MASTTHQLKRVIKNGHDLSLDIFNKEYQDKENVKLYLLNGDNEWKNKNVSPTGKNSFEFEKVIHAKALILILESTSHVVRKTNKQNFIKYYREKAAIKKHSTYDHALLHLISFNGKQTLFFGQLNENYLKGFIAYLTSQKLSVTSIRIYLSRINIILNLAVTEKIIQVNPFKYLTRGRGGDIPASKQKKIEFLTLAELRKMNDAVFREDIKQYFLFCCFTGLRQSDLLKLKWTNINEGTLSYTQKKQQDSIQHYLPLSKQARDLLKQIKETQKKKSGKISEYVFSHLPLSRAINYNLKRWAEKTMLGKNIHIHVGRHTFATLALSNKVSLYTVSKMLGHSSIAMTQIYGEIIDQVKQEAAELMPVL